MYVIVAFDVSKESVRGKIRRYLRSLGLSMVNRSVYAGPGGVSVVEKIRERVREIIDEGDNVFIILVQEQEYYEAIICSYMDCKRIEDFTHEVL